MLILLSFINTPDCSPGAFIQQHYINKAKDYTFTLLAKQSRNMFLTGLVDFYFHWFIFIFSHKLVLSFSFSLFHFHSYFHFPYRYLKKFTSFTHKFHSFISFFHFILSFHSFISFFNFLWSLPLFVFLLYFLGWQPCQSFYGAVLFSMTIVLPKLY